MTAQARISDVVSRTPEYSLVNLTKLSWRQPLVASTRLLLASGEIPARTLVRHDLSPLDDNDIRQFLSDYDVQRAETEADSAGVEGENPQGDRKTPEIQAYVYSEHDGDYSPADGVFEAQKSFAEIMYSEFSDRSRAGAVMSVLFAELGWQVRVIADVLGVSRPTVNKWVMTHVDEPLSVEDTVAVNTALTVYPTALIDVRNTEFRTKRSGLTWRKVVAMPTPEIATMMRALWRVSYRARGAKSTREERVCSFLLDLMLDLLIRRGMTAQNIASVMGMTHRAIFARLERSEVLNTDSGLWMSAHHIAPMINGFAADGKSARDELFTDADALLDGTVSHRPNGKSILLRVKTHAASAINPTPIVSVYALAAADRERSHLALDLLDLDHTSPNDLGSAVKKIARGKFRAAELDDDLSETRAKICDVLDRVRDGSFFDSEESPAADENIAGEIFGTNKYWFPSTKSRSDWRDGTVFAEALMVQATGQYDRDDESQNGTGRPGFGSVTYHWVPSSVLDRLVHIGFRDQIATETAAAREDRDSADSAAVLREFLPPAVMRAVDEWLSETEAPGDYERPAEFRGKSLLWTCLNRPTAVIGTFAAPKSLDSDDEKTD